MQAERIAWTTGEYAPNWTRSRAGVGGADLGIMWDDGRGGVLCLWGDTFDGPPGAGDWRSNVLARSTNRDYATRGVVIDWWATDHPGHAKQVIPRDRPEDFTIIPTSGISIGARQYATYMSIQAWGGPGRWTTNYAGFAYSDDGGVTWVKDVRARWSNTAGHDQPWQMCALARGGDGYLYVFGTPNGRAGAAHLARVPEDRVLDLSQHEQYVGEGRFVRAATDPVPVLPPPVSELSVAFHRLTGRWLAAYYHEDLNAVVVHDAPALYGPWSPPRIVATATEFPHLYGAFWHPWSMADTRPCFAMSQWPPYQTALMSLGADAQQQLLLL